MISQILVSISAALIAIAAWLTSIEALHSTYRPVLRPVPVRKRDTTDPTRLILKNIGRGPAVAVMLLENRSKPAPVLIAELDLVEPLGPRQGGPREEAKRVGRRVMEVTGPEWLQAGHTYRLFYQDIAGRWHETRFTNKEAFNVRYLGPKHWWQLSRQIPAVAKERGQVSIVAESEERED
jgi:hypothetical protein